MTMTYTSPTTWGELIAVEPHLAEVAELVGFLAPLGPWDGGRRYVTVRNVVAVLVGWGRGHQAPDGGNWDCDHDRDPFGRHPEIESHNLGQLKAELVAPPMSDTERWLRSSAAYDLAMDHVRDLLEAKGMA